MHISIVIVNLLLLFDCATALSHRHDRLRDAEVVVASWSGCAITGTVDGVAVQLFMDVANCPLHAKIPGKLRVRYDQTCGAVVEATDGPVITTPMPPSCPTQTPSPTPSPSIRGVSIIEPDGTRWSLGGRLETLRNGVHAGGGFGSIYKVVDGVIYVLGTDNDWYRWSGGWSWFSKLEPGGEVVTQPTPAPTPISTPQPTPQPSPIITPTPRPLPSIPQLPICLPNQQVGNPARCLCITGIKGNCRCQ